MQTMRHAVGKGFITKEFMEETEKANDLNQLDQHFKDLEEMLSEEQNLKDKVKMQYLNSNFEAMADEQT
jgi:hypothetical protein